MRFEELALKVTKKMNYSLYDVEIKGSLLRIFIDQAKGISIADCMAFDKEYTKHLEEEGLLNEQLILEVSSPGIYRKLKKYEHYENAVNEWIKIITKQNEVFVDILKEVSNNILFLGEREISFEEVQKGQIVEGKKK